MATSEEIFNSSRLDVIVPKDSFKFPTEQSDADEWLRAIAGAKHRDKAFFDERLHLCFIVKVPHPLNEIVNPVVPPLELAVFFSHLQVTLDAKYIAPQPSHTNHLHTSARGINFAPPPRSQSYPKPSIGSQGGPAIFPPPTPHPTPQAGEADRKYAGASSQIEGTILESFVWGETSRDDSADKSFALMWSNAENVWVAMYRLIVGVSFLRTNVAEPLLSLTISATLREKPLVITPERQVLAALIQTAGGRPTSGDQSSAATVNGSGLPDSSEELYGPEEVNLLEGLSLGPSFGGSAEIKPYFPSTRLSTSFRRATYSLPPVRPSSPNVTSPPTTALPSNPSRGMAPVLRKSFLKTLPTVSGFQIRMKSVFVPYVVIPGCSEDERREAGSEERTVVLSVELGCGSSLEGSGSTGFAVEAIDVTVGGEGAAANLIGWGDDGLKKSDAVFPLVIRPTEQFNLLYAITFLRQSEADDIADTLRNDANGEQNPFSASVDSQRPVAIVIHGKPFDFWINKEATLDNVNGLTYATQTFRSRWNCVLDLSAAGHTEILEGTEDPPMGQDALPAPASPFPATTPSTAKYTLDKLTSASLTPVPRAVAGAKRHTFGGLSDRGRHLLPGAHQRNSTPAFDASYSREIPVPLTPTVSSVIGGRPSVMPPSITIQTSTRFSNGPPAALYSPQLGPRIPSNDIPPPTPAYPAYAPETVPPTPGGQNPVGSFRFGGGGHHIEPRRERVVSGAGAGVGTPTTPGPRMSGFLSSFMDRAPINDAAAAATDPVVVTVGLIPPTRTKGRSGTPLISSSQEENDIIYALDKFGIEISVFNQSEQTKRFEVSYLDKSRRGRQQAAGAGRETYYYSAPVRRSGVGAHKQGLAPSLLPLENRIRVGPLRPHTCQSVRMQFLALRAGVHSISSLTLTDVETGYSMNLKSVMDVAVHELGQS